MRPASLEAAVAGCLAGLALGDALGTPTQPTPEATRARYGLIAAPIAPHADDASGHAGLRAGQVTDDTAAALALVEAVIAERRLTPEVAARGLLIWLDAIDAAHAPFIGPSTRAAYLALKRGAPPTESGLGGLTNGAAMRAAPVGFLAWMPALATAAWPERLRQVAAAAAWSAMPTHHSPLGLASAAAVAAATARASQLEADVEAIVEAAAAGAQAGAALYAGPPGFTPIPDLGRRVRWAADLMADVPPPGRDPHTWPPVVWRALRTLYDLSGAGMAAHETVPTALALVRLAAGDPVTAALLAANLGGDGDTIGAIAGAISGAYRGLAAFPAEWLAQLAEVNRLDFSALAARYVAAVRQMTPAV